MRVKSINYYSSMIAFNSHPYYLKGGVGMGDGFGGFVD
jgi:hypothetical protein